MAERHLQLGHGQRGAVQQRGQELHRAEAAAQAEQHGVQLGHVRLVPDSPAQLPVHHRPHAVGQGSAQPVRQPSRGPRRRRPAGVHVRGPRAEHGGLVRAALLRPASLRRGRRAAVVP